MESRPLSSRVKWRGFDVVGQCPERGLQRISVKTRNFGSSRNFVSYNDEDEFDWLAIVVLPATTRYKRRIFIVPRDVANSRSYSRHTGMAAASTCTNSLDGPPLHPTRCSHVDCGLADYENNFSLSVTPR